MKLFEKKPVKVQMESESIIYASADISNNCVIAVGIIGAVVVSSVGLIGKCITTKAQTCVANAKSKSEKKAEKPAEEK